ncbi:MAG: hypothetical protein WA970_24370, partial [Gammaproteobacteria bacterium]
MTDLVRGEIQFLRQRQDHLSAIARLQLAQQRALLSDDPPGAALLLAELLLDYGLHEAAAPVIRGMEEGGAPESMRNRGWHLLAKILFHKGYLESAMAALQQITGKVPQDIRGDHQLLQAHVLMALDSNQDAAETLRRWEGPRHQVGYAHYNRGIGLLRAGDANGAIDALRKVSDREAKGEGPLAFNDEEPLALKDKASLALGNLTLERGAPERAQEFFQRVRLQSPFSNRALLGAGWAALEQGRKREALTPWLELRGRTIIDPAVQEALLTVPAVQRELRSLATAARFYEEAIASFSSELERVAAAIDAVRENGVIRLRHSNPPGLTLARVSAPIGNSMAVAEVEVAPETRYIGRLLAGHEFQEAWRGYRDLRSLDETLSEWLRRLDALDDYQPPTLQANTLPPARDSSPATGHWPDDNLSATPRTPVGADGRPPSPSATGWVEQWEAGTRSGDRAPQRPPAGPLPQLELPPEQAVSPFPRSQFTGAPTASEVIWLPSDPEVLWLPPKPGVKWLPSADGARLPDGGSVRLPQPDDEQSPHPEFTARDSAPAAGQESPARRVLRAGPQASVA